MKQNKRLYLNGIKTLVYGATLLDFSRDKY